jgi:hypothetical protein
MIARIYYIISFIITRFLQDVSCSVILSTPRGKIKGTQSTGETAFPIAGVFVAIATTVKLCLFVPF